MSFSFILFTFSGGVFLQPSNIFSHLGGSFFGNTPLRTPPPDDDERRAAFKGSSRPSWRAAGKARSPKVSAVADEAADRLPHVPILGCNATVILPMQECNSKGTVTSECSDSRIRVMLTLRYIRWNGRKRFYFIVSETYACFSLFIDDNFLAGIIYASIVLRS